MSRLPSLVLVHGAGGSHLDWPPALRRFAGATVVAVDLPGHGRSEPPGKDRIDDYAAALGALLAALALGPTVVVGHSMGGAIALSLGLAPPPEVRGLVLIGTGARLRVMDALLTMTQQDFSAAVELICSSEWGSAAPDALRAAGRARLATANPQVTHADFAACNAFDMRQSLVAVRLPALVIAGGEDRLAPPKLSYALAEGLPNARLLTLPSAGHMIPLEQPAAVAGAIRSFLTEIA